MEIADLLSPVKHLLVASLQVLNNLTAANERRKLMLWFELFDNGNDTHDSGDSHVNLEDEEDPKSAMAQSVAKFDNIATGLLGLPPMSPDFKVAMPQATSPFLLFIGKHGMEVKRWLQDRGEKAGATEIAAECKKRWQALSEDQKQVKNLLACCVQRVAILTAV
jgi:palmitoyltransferase